MVEAMKTRYGPSRFFTRGRGMAAASSMTSSSAWPSFTASPGWMYCRGHRGHVRMSLLFETSLCSHLPGWSVDAPWRCSPAPRLCWTLDSKTGWSHSPDAPANARQNFGWESVPADRQKVWRGFYLILQSVKTFEDEFEHGVEVVWAWRGHEDVGVAEQEETRLYKQC